ncbi:MAG: class I SAM-dependent methyltransferase [Candidatus Aminicenantes bacterium]|nr:class I SAM-dependent methyltransferase [Candidatus Aminicenantes bacterium]
MQLKLLISKVAKLPGWWKRRRQMGRPRVIRNEVMKTIYRDFFNAHEEKKTPMLHRGDLYAPGPPVTMPSGEILEIIETYAGKSILDIGCGHGVYGRELLKKGFEYTGIEGDEGYAAEAAKYVNAFHMRAEKLEFPDKSFDTVIMLEVLEHLDDPYGALAEIVRVARKNLIVSVPNLGPMKDCVEHNLVMHHFLDGTHVNFFTGGMLERFLRDYFPYVKVTEFGQFFNLSGSKLYYHLAAIASFER